MELNNKLKSLKKKARRYQEIMNEGGDGYNPYYEEIRKFQAENGRELFLERWPLDTTISRRAEWNEFIRSTFEPGEPVDMSLVAFRQKEQGWTMSELKHAIEIHKI